MGRRRRVAALLVGLLMALSVSTSGASDGVRIDRYAGHDRYATSAAVLRAWAEGVIASCSMSEECDLSRHGEDCGRTGAINHFGVVRGDSFGDALASSSGDVVVVVHRDWVPPEALAVLREHTTCSPTVTVFGGPDVVGQAVIDQLIAEIGINPNVRRHAGDDRYATAAAVARWRHLANHDEQPLVRLYVATGEDWPDGLAMGPIGRIDIVVLTRRAELPEVTAAFIRDARPRNVFVVGGPSAVSDAVVAEIDAIAGSTDVEYLGSSRIAGPNRQGTALAIADHFFDPDWIQSVTIVRPDSFADSLVAPMAHAIFSHGSRSGPILIAASRDELGADNEGWIRRHAETITNIRVLGDAGVVSDTVAEQAARAADTSSPG